MPTPSWDTKDITSRKMAKHLEKTSFLYYSYIQFLSIATLLVNTKNHDLEQIS
jgi:Tfp pilus assembly protein PilZ